MGKRAAKAGDTPLDNLAYLADVLVKSSTLERCAALVSLMCEELHINNTFPIGKSVSALRDVLVGTVTQARERVLEALQQPPYIAEKEASEVAAAGELIELHDADLFRSLREIRRISDQVWAKALGDEDNQGPVRQRRLHGGVWLKCSAKTVGQKKQPFFSAMTVYRQRISLLKALEGAIKVYLADPSVAQPLREYLSAPALSNAEADEALRPEAPSSNSSKEPDNQATTTITPYVDREKLHQVFNKLLRERTPVIVLSGPPGVGKARLASKLTPQTGGRIWLRATNRQTLLRDVVDILDTERHDITGPEAVLFRKFQHLLSSKYAPKYLVIEDLENVDLLDELIPNSTDTRVVVTIERSLKLKNTNDNAYIEVGELEIDEAKLMVNHLLPDIDAGSDSAARLAETLGGHALAIEAACGLLRDNKDLDINSLCDVLPEHVVPLLDSPADNEERYNHPPLTTLYRRTLGLLKKENPHAPLVLEMIVCLDSSHIPVDLSTICLADILGFPPDAYEAAKPLAKRAISALQRRYLVRSEEGGLNIHRFTKIILHGITIEEAEKAQTIRSSLYEGIWTLLRKRRQKLAALDPITFLSSQAAMLPHLWCLGTSPWGTTSDPEHGIKTIAIAHRMMLHIADPKLRARYVTIGLTKDEKLTPDEVEQIVDLINNLPPPNS